MYVYMNMDFFWGMITGWMLGGAASAYWFVFKYGQQEAPPQQFNPETASFEAPPPKKTRTMWGD